MVRYSVNMVRCPVNMVRCPVNMVRCPVNMVRCPVNMVRCPVNMVRQGGVARDKQRNAKPHYTAYRKWPERRACELARLGYGKR